MAKIISLASSKVKSIQGGYEINDPAYVDKLIQDTNSIIGGISKGLNLFVNDGIRFYAVYITGEQTFADLPKLFEIQPLAAPVLSSPLDNAIDVAPDATLSWASVAGAEGYELDLDGVVIPLTATTYQIDSDYEAEHTWKVRAIGKEIPGTWSEEQTFTIEVDPQE